MGLRLIIKGFSSLVELSRALVIFDKFIDKIIHHRETSYSDEHLLKKHDAEDDIMILNKIQKTIFTG
jgi:hypothetical protein